MAVDRGKWTVTSDFGERLTKFWGGIDIMEGLGYNEGVGDVGMPYVRMSKELKKDFARFCEKRGVSMGTAFRKMAKMAVRKDKDVDEKAALHKTAQPPDRENCREVVKQRGIKC